MKLLEGVLDVEAVDPLVERLATIGAEHGCTVVALDARYVIDREQIERSIALAKRAFQRGENVADTPAIEVLLYVAGRRQIDRALAVGVGTGTGPVVIGIERWIEPDTDGKRRTGESSERERRVATTIESTLGAAFDRTGTQACDEPLIREFFSVSDAELAATDAGLAALVHERTALLDVEK